MIQLNNKKKVFQNPIYIRFVAQVYRYAALL